MKKLTSIFLVALIIFSINACKSEDTPTTPVEPVEDIVGTWVSEGANVAPLLVTLFKVTKITATFDKNGTYEVIQVDSAGTSLTLTGTYTVEKSSVGNIYKITANQQSPTALTSEGIYEIDKTATPNTMKYEVVQTSPNIGAVPPTPEGGFGSTNGGALGTLNVQNYVRQ